MSGYSDEYVLRLTQERDKLEADVERLRRALTVYEGEPFTKRAQMRPAGEGMQTRDELKRRLAVAEAEVERFKAALETFKGMAEHLAASIASFERGNQ